MKVLLDMLYLVWYNFHHFHSHPSGWGLTWEYSRDLDNSSSKEEIINAPDNAGLELLLWVCEYIKNDRFPEAELEIIKHPYFAFRYANEIIKDRWFEAEPIILTDNYITYQYIINVIKDRWLEGERTFNTYWWSVYKETFLKKLIDK